MVRDIDQYDSLSVQSMRDNIDALDTTPIDLIHPELDKQHAHDVTSSELHEDVRHHIQVSTVQILDNLRAYHRTRNELVLMV